MAILYRTNANHVLEETFMKSNIPYTMVESKIDCKEIKDLLSYLRGYC